MNKNYIQVILTVLSITVVSASFTPSSFGLQHQVKQGETLTGIAQKYNVSMKSIAQANKFRNNDYDHLRIGQKLTIPGVTNPPNAGGSIEGTVYTIEQGDSLYSIARKFNVEDWKQLQKANAITNPKHLQPGQQILIPNGVAIGFLEPLKVPLVVTSQYGYRHHPITRRYRLHEGIDFRASNGTRVYASKTGVVTYAARKSGYGKIVIIQHDDDYTTSYGHLSRIRVSKGDIVRQGQVIGLSGNTGFSTGPHLHFEVRYKGRSENPARHLNLQ
ncbi:M23 family metallopeptidase [Candidatus Poribacteria bacterium]|nr:M23 family metallopeptidase [Candidatus Poribacteria bacterium]